MNAKIKQIGYALKKAAQHLTGLEGVWDEAEQNLEDVGAELAFWKSRARLTEKRLRFWTKKSMAFLEYREGEWLPMQGQRFGGDYFIGVRGRKCGTPEEAIDAAMDARKNNEGTL